MNLPAIQFLISLNSFMKQFQPLTRIIICRSIISTATLSVLGNRDYRRTSKTTFSLSSNTLMNFAIIHILGFLILIAYIGD
uniref:Uncharacterized protein n=1 Tax=Cannabis sativa TaxID=3483 RepID=A0A803QZT2_CANSA